MSSRQPVRFRVRTTVRVDLPYGMRHNGLTMLAPDVELDVAPPSAAGLSPPPDVVAVHGAPAIVLRDGEYEWVDGSKQSYDTAQFRVKSGDLVVCSHCGGVLPKGDDCACLSEPNP